MISVNNYQKKIRVTNLFYMNCLEVIVFFEGLTKELKSINLHFYIEDSSEADASAEVFAEYHLEDVIAKPSANSFQLPLSLKSLPAQSELSLRVHADVNKSGSLSPGDYFTTVYTPLALPLNSGPVKVLIQKI
jgi:hypothetical protein